MTTHSGPRNTNMSLHNPGVRNLDGSHWAKLRGVTGPGSLGRLQAPGTPQLLDPFGCPRPHIPWLMALSVFRASHGSQSWSRGVPPALCKGTGPTPPHPRAPGDHRARRGKPGSSPHGRAGCRATIFPPAASCPLLGQRNLDAVPRVGACPSSGTLFCPPQSLSHSFP